MSQVRALVAEHRKQKAGLVPVFCLSIFSDDQGSDRSGVGRGVSSPVEEGLGKPWVSQMFCPGRGTTASRESRERPLLVRPKSWRRRSRGARLLFFGKFDYEGSYICEHLVFFSWITGRYFSSEFVKFSVPNPKPAFIGS